MNKHWQQILLSLLANTLLLALVFTDYLPLFYWSILMLGTIVASAIFARQWTDVGALIIFIIVFLSGHFASFISWPQWMPPLIKLVFVAGVMAVLLALSFLAINYPRQANQRQNK